MSGASSVFTLVFIVSERGGARRGVGGGERGDCAACVEQSIDGMSMSAKRQRGPFSFFFGRQADR